MKTNRRTFFKKSTVATGAVLLGLSNSSFASTSTECKLKSYHEPHPELVKVWCWAEGDCDKSFNCGDDHSGQPVEVACGGDRKLCFTTNVDVEDQENGNGMPPIAPPEPEDEEENNWV